MYDPGGVGAEARVVGRNGHGGSGKSYCTFTRVAFTGHSNGVFWEYSLPVHLITETLSNAIRVIESKDWFVAAALSVNKNGHRCPPLVNDA